MPAVTRPDGEVIGCPGLYVMDAAAFPRSVGVNPSAAILAIAEYKVEKFIDRPGQPNGGPATSTAPEVDGEDGGKRRRTLDPLGHLILGQASEQATQEQAGQDRFEEDDERCGTRRSSVTESRPISRPRSRISLVSQLTEGRMPDQPERNVV
jgi:hypothetical protein